jgi:hypothetical protein
MSPRREYTAVLSLLLGAGVLGLVASGAVWRQDAARPPFAVLPEAVTGVQAAPEVRAAALVALAGSLAVLATGRRGRLVVGVLVAGAGAAGAVGAAGSLAAATTWWPAVALGSSTLLVLAGSALAVRGGQWPTPGARYDRGAPRVEGPRSTWEALDRGEDPTV